MQLEDWTRLSGLTHLSLADIKRFHHPTLAAVVPRLTTLQSLVARNWWPRGPGGRCPCCQVTAPSS
jgi:hypothetical protein